MDAHDDLAHLFRQVGAACEGYREFAVPELPTTPPATLPDQAGPGATPAARAAVAATDVPLTASPRRTPPSVYGLPDISPAA